MKSRKLAIPGSAPIWSTSLVRYGLGVKEVWEVPEENHNAGMVVHTVGWPLGMRNYGPADHPSAVSYGRKNGAPEQLETPRHSSTRGRALATACRSRISKSSSEAALESCGGVHESCEWEVTCGSWV